MGLWDRKTVRVYIDNSDQNPSTAQWLVGVLETQRGYDESSCSSSGSQSRIPVPSFMIRKPS